jgi:hypothetical protein
MAVLLEEMVGEERKVALRADEVKGERAHEHGNRI